MSAIAAPTSSTPAISAGLIGRLTGVELLKLRTTRMWWGLLIGASAFVILVTLFLSLGFISSDPPPAGLMRYIYGAGFSQGQIFVLLLGVTAMAGEYRHKTITSTFLATPQRGLVVIAKMLAMFVVGVAYGVLLTLAAAIPAIIVLAAHGHGPELGADGVVRTIALSLLGSGLWGVYGVGLAVLVRNQIAAIIIAIAVQFVLGPIVDILSTLNDVVEQIVRFLPGPASAALVSGSLGDAGGPGLDLLPWWAGGLVMLAYAVGLALIGWALTTRRDIS